MSKKLFIHIGPHKTGTTYIQQSLSRHREFLDSVGLYYPLIPHASRFQRFAHHTVVKWIKEKKSSEIIGFTRSLKKITLLSSEEFSHLNENNIKYFVNQIPDTEVEIIYSKRRLAPLLVSRWQEYVKHGGTESWSVYFLKHLLKDSKRNLINGVGTLTHWSDLVGKSSIHILDYEQCIAEDLDIADALLQIIMGAEAPRVGTGKSINPSLDSTHTELLRWVNLHFQASGERPGPQHRQAFIMLLKKDDPEIEQALDFVRSDMITLTLSGTPPINALENDFSDFTGFQSSYQGYVTEMKYQLPGEQGLHSLSMINCVEKIAEKVRANM